MRNIFSLTKLNKSHCCVSMASRSLFPLLREICMSTIQINTIQRHVCLQNKEIQYRDMYVYNTNKYNTETCMSTKQRNTIQRYVCLQYKEIQYRDMYVYNTKKYNTEICMSTIQRNSITKLPRQSRLSQNNTNNSLLRAT